MLKVEHNRIIFEETGFTITFQRTLRVPDDGNTYPLPAGFGPFPIHRVEDFASKVPAKWLEHGGVFIPMAQREALWVSLSGPHWQPHAVKVAVGKVNAITGKPWTDRIGVGEQDYLVCPPQPWLDGIKSADGKVSQFVAMPLGMKYTVEAQVTGKETVGGMQIKVFAPHAGRFQKPQANVRRERFVKDLGLESMEYLCSASPMMSARSLSPAAPGMEMGIAAGGSITQKIYPDDYGMETWDNENTERIFVHIVNSAMYSQITGLPMPTSPITAQTYQQYGIPWFDLYDDRMGDVDTSNILANVQTVSELDKKHGFENQQDDTPIDAGAPIHLPVHQPKKPKNGVSDGKW